MKRPIAIIGVGEMGGVFARGLLKSGHPVFPITREMDLATVEGTVQELEAVIVAVGEKDLQTTLSQMPPSWHQKCVLLQNELLPNDWIQHGITAPTVISVWFEKKRPNDYKVIIPSPVYGPHAQLIKHALEAIDITCNHLENEEALLFELVLKNLYILTTNISGLEVGGNVGQLWDNHQDLARVVANDVLDIQFKLAEKELDRENLIAAMVEAFNGDLEHKCMGRSAPARIERAIQQADEHGLEVKKLRAIQANQSKPV